MPTYRTFRNTAPPVLAALWQSRAGQPGLTQPVTSDLLEQLVFAKLYFDYDGLFLAWDEGRPVGFAHAGFGPDSEKKQLSTEAGTTCVMAVRPDCDENAIASGLLERCEEYLRRRGAQVLYGGVFQPLDPFYLGLYGGSCPAGVLDSDVVAKRVFAASGYREIERSILFRRELNGFEAVIDRRQMQVRRQMVVEVTVDAPTRNWWEACTLGAFDLTRFQLVPRVGGSAVATAVFRGMEPSGTASVGRAMGLIDLSVAEPYRRRGLAIFLLSEALRQFLRQGIVDIETQTSSNDLAMIGLLQKLGFRQVDQAGVWRKE